MTDVQRQHHADSESEVGRPDIGQLLDRLRNAQTEFEVKSVLSTLIERVANEIPAYARPGHPCNLILLADPVSHCAVHPCPLVSSPT